MTSESILVTGGAGFIGSSFVRLWLRENEGRVVNVDKLTYAGHLANLREVAEDPRHDLIRGDVCDRELLAEMFAESRPRAVVHFAAESHVDRKKPTRPD